MSLLFETERLSVRALSSGDERELLRVYGNPTVVRWVGDGQVLTQAEAEAWVSVTQRNYERRGYGMSAVLLEPEGEPIGFCGIVHPQDQVEPEIKYAFAPEHWGQGFATEVVRGMLAYGRSTFGLGAVIATVAPENDASLHVLGKLGFERQESRPNADGSVTVVLRQAH